LLKNAVFEKKSIPLPVIPPTLKVCMVKVYALLGNAGEFLDPWFSSGVTIA